MRRGVKAVGIDFVFCVSLLVDGLWTINQLLSVVMFSWTEPSDLGFSLTSKREKSKLCFEALFFPSEVLYTSLTFTKSSRKSTAQVKQKPTK